MTTTQHTAIGHAHDPSQLDLAHQLAAHPAFNWLPWMGAIDKDGRRWRAIPSDPDCGLRAVGEGHCGYVASWGLMAALFGAVPDINDDCTKGVLLGMVRGAWNNPGLYASLQLPYREGTTDGAVWRIVLVDVPGALPQVVCAPTEGEVLALALLEAL